MQYATDKAGECSECIGAYGKGVTMLKCPDCESFGVYAVKRHWWQRLANLPHRYECHDCGRFSSKAELIEERGVLQYPTSLSVGPRKA
ncbi:hypothetical protein DFO67_1145 [Modicisalibacter xianhensis]|uniref:Uncharacterized protein n=1 Tax=Modicisalibacter xianhensis TaxID=442341 RepID=A0A4V3GTI4_9GAMM|nr:hypothetical protein DFO67_1145 [Halomonas xianhensis]